MSTFAYDRFGIGGMSQAEKQGVAAFRVEGYGAKNPYQHREGMWLEAWAWDLGWRLGFHLAKAAQ